MLLLACAGAASAQTKVEYDVAKRLAQETFETAGTRAGTPEIIREDVAPAVFVQTGKGVYTVGSDRLYDGVTALLPEPYEMRLPEGEGEWLQIGFVLHRFQSEPAPASCSARFFIGPAEDVKAGKQDAYTLATAFAVLVSHAPKTKEVDIALYERFGDIKAPGRCLYRANCGAGNLPLGFRVFLSRDRYAIAFTKEVNSLSGRPIGEQGFGKAMAGLPSPLLRTGIRLVNHEAGSRSRMVLDDFEANVVRVREMADVRPEARPKRRFEVAGDKTWRLVWGDEFDGKEIDAGKWRVAEQGPRDLGKEMPKSYLRKECVSLDGQGHVRIRFGLDKDGNLESGDLSSLFNKTYGYFEARLKLTRQPGWWAAFWLNRPNPGANPFTNGLEIDVLEDFWQKSRKDDTLQHALHIGVPSPYGKSFTQDAQVPNWDDWHTFGVDWGPLETVIYVNGVETACFDTSMGVTTMPCQILLSGCIGSGAATFTGSYKDAKLPEEFAVDYVRVYEKDTAGKQAPAVKILGEGRAAKEGDRLVLEVSPAGRPQEVLLFDNGYLLERKTQPPYRFEVALTEEYFRGTSYMKRSSTRGVTSILTEHVFVAMAKDAAGLVGISAPVEFNVESGTPSRPFEGKAQAIPGRVELERFDEGGMGCAYSDVTPENTAPGTTFRKDEGVDTAGESIGWTAHGEWMKYTVDVAKAGKYTITVPFGCGLQQDYDKGLRLELDGKRLKDLPLTGLTGNWSATKLATFRGVELPAGRHVLTMRILGGALNLDYMELAAGGP